MKKFTKTLSIVLLVAMCVSMFTISSFADGHICADYVGKYESAKEVEGFNPKCEEEGRITYYICSKPNCGKLYKTDACLAEDEITLADTVVAPLGHDLYVSEGKVPTCTDGGTADVKFCKNGCAQHFDMEGNVIPSGMRPELEALGHDMSEWVVTPAIVGQAGSTERSCQREGCTYEEVEEIPALDKEPFIVSGTNPAEFDADGTYTYTCDAEHEFEYVKVGDVPIYDDVGCFIGKNKVTVMGSAVASLMSGKTSIELTFIAEDGCIAGGFTLNSASTTSKVKVDGFEQKGTLKGSIEHVFFTTDDPQPTHVILYSVRSGNNVAITEYEFTPLGGGRYTYTFGNDFLNKLDAGTYYVRSIYGDGKFVEVGTIIVTNSWQTAGSSDLTFSNSSIGLKEFKYVSGGTRPELYCDMFRDSDAVLQISNDGNTWKNVSVYDYYIEQSNGKDTSYAWIKTSLLDNQKAASNVYFRVIIPAVDAGKSEDVMSNWVKVTTGNNLKAVDTDKHVINSSKSLKFVASVPVDVVKVGTIPLTEGDDYSLSNDGKTITLFADFLNKRTAGSTYTLTAITEEGDEELKTTFKILTTAQASASPRTGDDSNIALWSALVLMSGAAVVAVLPRLKKEK